MCTIRIVGNYLYQAGEPISPPANLENQNQMNVITYQPRNDVGQYSKVYSIKQWLLKVKLVAIKVYRIARIVTVSLTIVLALWGLWLTNQVYTFRCQVNYHTIGYLSRRAECDQANQNWMDSQQNTIDQHVAAELAQNPDLR